MQSATGETKSPGLEFVIIIASMTALIAFLIDAMLPALATLGSDLAAEGNDRQLVVSYLFLGLASGQLFDGPLSGSIGRRPAVLFGFGDTAWHAPAVHLGAAAVHGGCSTFPDPRRSVWRQSASLLTLRGSP